MPHCTCPLPQEQVKGYTALTQQLAADYNVHGAAVMGHAAAAGQQGAAAGGAGSSRRRGAGASSSAAAAAAGGGQAAEGEMSDEENRRHRDHTGGGFAGLRADTAAAATPVGLHSLPRPAADMSPHAHARCIMAQAQASTT